MTTSIYSLLRPLVAVAVIMFVGWSPASAALVFDTFAGNDCGGQGGFAACTASASGTAQNGSGSPAIYKLDSGGEEDFGNFPTITGDEFSLSFDGDTHVLSWTYTPGTGDPLVRYFTIKQANGFALFHDDGDAPIYSFSADIDALLGYNSFSHVAWFDSVGTQSVVPIPGALPLFLSALGGLGLVARRRRRTA